MKILKSGSKLANKILQAINIAVLVFGAAILFLGCEKEIERIEAFRSTENLPVISSTYFETTYTDSFKVQFYMKTPLLQKFESDGQPYLEFPQGVLLVKYDQNEQIVSRITSDYAKQYEREQRWEAKNNVIAVNAAGDTLKTEHLIWEEKSGRIYSDKFVKIIRPDQIITGIGFESDQYMRNWNIKDVKGPIYIDVEKESLSTEEEMTVPETPAETRKPLQLEK